MLSDIRYLLAMGWHASRWRSATLPIVWLYQAAAACAPLLAGIATTAAIAGHWDTVGYALLGFTALAGCGFAVTAVAGVLELQLTDAVAHESNLRIARGIMGLPTLDDVDDEDVQQALSLAASRQGVLGDAYAATVTAMGPIIVSIATVGAALAVDWRVLLLVPVGGLHLLVMGRYQKLEMAAQAAAHGPETLLRRWLHTLRADTARRELHQADAAGVVARRLGSAAHEWAAARTRAQFATNALDTAASAVYALAVVGVLYVVAEDPGKFVAAVMLAGQLKGLMRTVSTTWLQLVRGTTQVRHIRALERATADHPTATTGRDATVSGEQPAADTAAALGGHTAASGGSAESTDAALVYEHLTYSYPGHEADDDAAADSSDADGAASEERDGAPGSAASVAAEDAGAAEEEAQATAGAPALLPERRAALQDISARIPLGKTTAIVGRNGSGKTTLTDIILGMRGQGLPHIDPADSSVVAQFPVHLPLGLAANVYAGNPDKRDSDTTPERVRHALSLAGAADLPEEGDYSGGQWQRIAHARALFADTPVIVLDEPTSALDAFAEKALLDQLLSLRGADATTHNTGDASSAPQPKKSGHPTSTAEEPYDGDTAAAGARPRTVVLVTHRMFMAARCDHIIVMNDGKVVEEGSPSELFQAQGTFARLWALENSDI
ncbi:hypothetical protein C1Y63_11860 [Corynebacterium sp. 13CS0277]|uniref:ATP-binding cassette domain-containing protein n=1 Tax=Corynebacterium sp. 13CS0277 TaxID=2071994 RepID=UPI000D0275F7|nr:ATP-binding cassette domain-containing protein [Corynebacterium sp. 13CS0277]PRQ10366.1 hypothetical protein C1Y63_11860 [Corynebacterium sp. 13CS0277]